VRSGSFADGIELILVTVERERSVGIGFEVEFLFLVAPEKHLVAKVASGEAHFEGVGQFEHEGLKLAGIFQMLLADRK